MVGKCLNMSGVRMYLKHFLPALQKIQKKRSSLPQRQRAIGFAADFCLARTAMKGSAWTQALNVRLMHKKKTMTTMKIKESSFARSQSITLARRMRLGSFNSRCYNNVDFETGHREHVAIDRKLGTLQTLVPGGRNMGIDNIFQETADYILNLQMQVHAMEALANFYTTNSAGLLDESVVQQQQGPTSLAAQI